MCVHQLPLIKGGLQTSQTKRLVQTAPGPTGSGKSSGGAGWSLCEGGSGCGRCCFAHAVKSAKHMRHAALMQRVHHLSSLACARTGQEACNSCSTAGTNWAARRKSRASCPIQEDEAHVSHCACSRWTHSTGPCANSRRSKEARAVAKARRG